MSKLGFLVAVSVVSLGAAVGAWYYKYQLYGWLPSTASSELKNVDGLLMDKEGKRERQKFCVHGIIGARQTGASNEHEHQTQFS